MKITGTNVFTMARLVIADGTIPGFYPGDRRHLKRCLTAGLLEQTSRGLKITDAGVDAIRADDWHPTNREALERLGR